MKQWTALILAFACAVILFAGCAEQSTYQPVAVDNVTISIADISATGATVVIQDSNELPYVYGEWYQIEMEKNGQWYPVKTLIRNYGFHEIGYLPDDHGQVEFTVNWEWLYGKLPAGNYRLLKQAGSSYISVEFRVGAI